MANNVRRYGLGILYAPTPNPVPPVAAHSVRHKMQTCLSQNADPFATKPQRGTRSGRTCAPLAHRTAMANNVRRYGLGILYALRRNPCHL